jgi:sulfide dehydrogenase cytochrome subunit
MEQHRENDMKKQNNNYVVLACSALLGWSLSAVAFAVEVTPLIESCFSCHGKNGNSDDPEIPNIASYSEDYLGTTMKRYQKKERPCVETEIRSGSKKGEKTDMCKIAAGLSKDDIEQIGMFFVEQTFTRTPQTFDAALAKQGKKIHNKRCYTCHAEAGSVPSDHAGILAGQKMSYLKQQLKYFKEGKRPMNKKMKPKLEALEDGEIEAVINFYGSLK